MVIDAITTLCHNVHNWYNYGGVLHLKEARMKTLFRILIIATSLGIVYYYTNVDSSETELLKGAEKVIQPVVDVPTIQFELDLPRPTAGISTLIGKSGEGIVGSYGNPNRIDKTGFGYEWWIYNLNEEILMMGVDNNEVTQVYTNSAKFNPAPYKIDQSLEDVYRMTIFEQEVTVEIDDNIYMFAMNEQDMKNRILVKYEDVFAQVYIDGQTQLVDGVRFLDGKTLVLHKPYELQFVGELLEVRTPSSYDQIEINLANGKQLTELTNAYRLKNDLPALQQLTLLNSVAAEQSENLFLENMELKGVETVSSLKERLEENGVLSKYSGENIASNYKDAIEVVHGWMNSKDHRALLMNERFSHMGSGAFVNYFSQLYVGE